MIKSKRCSAGNYMVSDGDLEVELLKQDFWDGPGWLAISMWDRHLVTDPLDRKWQALESAIHMIEEEQAARKKIADKKTA